MDDNPFPVSVRQIPFWRYQFDANSKARVESFTELDSKFPYRIKFVAANAGAIAMNLRKDPVPKIRGVERLDHPALRVCLDQNSF